MIVDVAAARVIAANRQASELLTGQPALASGGLQLDRGTPALGLLERILARKPGSPAQAADLLFWSDTGTALVYGLCETIAASGGRQTLVRVTSAKRAEPIEPTTRPRLIAAAATDGSAAPDLIRPASQAFDAASDGDAAAPLARYGNGPGQPSMPVARDDSLTLREIARRIRLGPQADEQSDGPAWEEAPAAAHPLPELPSRWRDSRPIALPGSADRPVAATVEIIRQSPRTATSVEPNADEGKWTEIEIAKLSHELRTPLAAIVALAEIMRDERLGQMGNARYRGYAADIHDSAMHAIAILKATVDQPEKASEKPALALVDTDANAIISSCVSAMRPLADRAGVQLSASLAARLPKIRADERTLKQILLNLLSNALRHTPQGGEISVGSGHRTDGEVRIEVRDTGSGMAAEEIEWALSGRADSTRRTSPSGSTGFGLPLVNKLVEANGAQLSIESRAGAGTRVLVTFRT